jgi:hypothetical protein
MTEKISFKQCSMCKQEWQNRDAFLNDNALELNGYSADFEELENGLFFFTHKIPGCSSTMTIRAKVFLDLYSGEIYYESKKGGEDCPKFCLERRALDRCPAFCEYAFVREVIQIILKRQQGEMKESSVHRIKNGVYNVASKQKDL